MAMSIFPGYDLDRAAKIFKPVRARVLRKWLVPFRVMPALLANCLCGKSKTVNPRNFFAELKRRNVYKVAVGYAVVGWLVMQVAATVVPALHLPDAITSAVVLLVILGFPIALIIAWAFELTPEGLKRTEFAD